jgi:hypothetical protein
MAEDRGANRRRDETHRVDGRPAARQRGVRFGKDKA